MRLFLLAIIFLAISMTAQAQVAPIGFQSPSRNIFCQFFDDNTQATVRCDIMEATVTAPRPRDCPLAYGKAFEISNIRGRPGGRICHGDTVEDRTLPVLAYGAVWQRRGFTCTSEQTGVTCFNAERRGFSLSRASQSVF